MATTNSLDNSEIIKDETSLVLPESDNDGAELSVLLYAGKRESEEDIPIDCELVVTTTSDDENLIGDINTQNVSSSTCDNASSKNALLSTCTVSNEQAIDRKFKDRMRKRKLRQSSEYRQKETVRSRSRIKLRRSDPEYREKERERDRERRQRARANNPKQRAIERERDRLYKKRVRDHSKVDFVVNSVSHEIILIDGTSSNTVVIEPVVKESD